MQHTHRLVETKLLLIFIPSLLLYAKAQITATISPDQDYNAALDNTSMIRFNCTATGNIVEWRVDGSPANFESITSRGVSTTPTVSIGGGVFFSSLSIRASSENDNTSIRCISIRTEPTFSSNTSQSIFLNIQGLLGPPPNLTLSAFDENGTRTLSWDAPETLDLTDIEPDILHYRVCHNLTSDMNCKNTTSSQERSVDVDFCNVSVPVLITVAAVNVVGVGKNSSTLCPPFDDGSTAASLSVTSSFATPGSYLICV